MRSHERGLLRQHFFAHLGIMAAAVMLAGLYLSWQLRPLFPRSGGDASGRQSDDDDASTATAKEIAARFPADGPQPDGDRRRELAIAAATAASLW